MKLICATSLLFLLGQSHGFGIGGGTLMFGSSGFFPRPRSNSLADNLGGSRHGGGVMYFRDPSPSHLRYPDNSYKTRMEAEKQNEENTRWDWINSMAEKYEEASKGKEKEDNTEQSHTKYELAEASTSPVKVRVSRENEESEAEMIVNGLLRKIQELDQRKRRKTNSPVYTGRFSKESLANASVGPRPPLLLMG